MPNGAREAVDAAHEAVDEPHGTVDAARDIAALLSARGESVAAAESSTGGLILSLLSDIPGASAWLRGGVVAYTNDAKRDILGVGGATMAGHGAVSAATAREMALGALRLFGATWAIGETGIAGPQTGRRSGKAAGLCYIAIAGQDGGHAVIFDAQVRLDRPGDRVAVKRAFAGAALAALLAALRARTG